MKLTPERIRAAIVACDGVYQDAAKKLGVSKGRLYDRIHALRVAGHTFPKATGWQKRIDSFYVPTPAEIAAACDVIREGWDEAERERRQVTKPPPWTPPGVTSELDEIEDIW